MGQLATFDGEKKFKILKMMEAAITLSWGPPFKECNSKQLNGPGHTSRGGKKQQGQDHGLIRGTPRVEMIYNHAEKLLKSPSARMYAALDLATPVPGWKNANKSQIRL